MIHPNSIEASRAIDHTERKAAVLRTVQKLEVATVREIAVRLGFSDMNAVRPRVTELIQEGSLVLADNVTDLTTGRSVYRVKVPHTADVVPVQ